MDQFKQRWWVELTKGIIVLGFGLYCLIRPQQALAVVGLIAGIAMLSMAVVFLIVSLRLQRDSKNWWIVLVEAGVNLVLGLILVFAPRDAADWLVRSLGLWVIFIGLFRFARLWVIADYNRSVAILSGVGGLLLGIILLIYPSFITMSITVIVGTVLALFGVFVTMDAIRQKNNSEA